ncbi:MAG: DUF4372 domain-containing protein, partial [Paramuribaculum sp.]|nr:DUF4372 domain-containing protein [Paramuribaculum sp.]
MGKSNHFLGQLIKSLNKAKITEFSLKHGGERYIKKFNYFTHLLTMLYGVMTRFESLREIETAMTAEV